VKPAARDERIRVERNAGQRLVSKAQQRRSAQPVAAQSADRALRAAQLQPDSNQNSEASRWDRLGGGLWEFLFGSLQNTAGTIIAALIILFVAAYCGVKLSQ
jgi:hypothetical protein